MAQTAKAIREHRTMTVDCHDEAADCQLLDDPNAVIEVVLAFLRSLGFQLHHPSTCNGGGLTRHSHEARVRLGGLTRWRLQCTRCKAVCTGLPHLVWRDRRMSPEVARQARIATHGGLRLAWCATLWHSSPMPRDRLSCALGQHRLVSVLLKCHLLLPASLLADAKHSQGLTERVDLPTIVSGRVIWQG